LNKKNGQSKFFLPGGVKRLGLLPALLLVISLFLSACGNNESNVTPGTPNPSTTASVQLSPITINSNSNSPTAGNGTSGDVTSTPVIAPTPTADTKFPTAIATRPTSTPLPPTSTPAATAAPFTATPVFSGTPVAVDQDVELKTIKAAYDAINKHLFKEPDTAAILTAGLKEVASVTGQTAPDVTFGTDVDGNWNTFTTAFAKLLDADKGFDYPKDQLAWRVVNVMADAVGDEHTYFMDAASYQSRQNLLSGNNSSVGFGIVVTTQNGKAYIVRVVGGSPADKAGIKAGDQIVSYDGTLINDKTWSLIKSAQENEAHTFVLARSGSAQPVTVQVTKGSYTLPTVEYRLINGHIGYIAIRDFFLNVADETDKAMTELRKQGADSWILDVRENPGGINVEQVTGRFVAGGEVMGYNTNRTSHDPMKVSNDLQDSPNKGKPFSPLLPLVLLQDDVSASSSEMLALAVRDFKLGPLIGVKTAGALGHTAAYPLGDGSAISVTVDVYESRGGEKVNGIGVTPDITVERTIDDIVAGRDPQLSAGVDYLEKLVAKKNP
jgi:carboxyl-terminal processing protease